MSQNKKPLVFISDFDGTISKEDFFYFVIDRLLTEDDVRPWQDYLERKISHVAALTNIFNKVRLSKEAFHKFVLELPLEECFIPTVNYCFENKIDYYILSAGADYYIKLILEHLNITDKVKLVSNRSIYTAEGGLQILEPDIMDPFYSIEYGISKKIVVESIKSNYDFSVFAGDGGPDIEPAKVVDKVFARGRLLELCRENNIDATEFKSYCEILDYLKSKRV